MAIGVLVEALLPGGATMASGGGGEPPPKDEKGLKEWVRSKLKALASLLGKLGMKAAEALPGIIGGIISCHCFDLYEVDGFLCMVDHWSPRLPEILQFFSLASLHSKIERHCIFHCSLHPG